MICHSYLHRNVQGLAPLLHRNFVKGPTNFGLCGGGRWSPNFVLVGILIFLWLRSPCKILEPYNNPFRDFSNGGKIKERSIPKIVEYLSCSAGRTHFAWANSLYTVHQPFFCKLLSVVICIISCYSIRPSHINMITFICEESVWYNMAKAADYKTPYILHISVTFP